MEKQNITLSLPKDLLQKAKLLAVKRHESVSGLLGKTLESLVKSEAAYQGAKTAAMRRMKKGFNLGTGGNIGLSRESLHDR